MTTFNYYALTMMILTASCYRLSRLCSRKLNIRFTSTTTTAITDEIKSILNEKTHTFIQTTFHNKKILVCGDGDFSFSRALSSIANYESMTTTTLDTQEGLKVHFPEAVSNIDDIVNRSSSRSINKVQYEVDATQLSNTLSSRNNLQIASNPNDSAIPLASLDIVLWNFPHINGKQNIRYNRQLLFQFLLSAKSYLNTTTATTNSLILLSLCQGQSGIEAKTLLEWNRSWKLLLQAAEAGLNIIQILPFQDTLNLEVIGYKPQGHRGFGGRFNIEESVTYILSLPSSSSSSSSLNTPHSKSQPAIQAPVYVHEVHMYINLSQLLPRTTYFNSISNNSHTEPVVIDISSIDVDELTIALERVEKHVRQTCIDVCEKHESADRYWCCDLVDVYICPFTQSVTLAHQVGYCSLTEPLSRSQADLLRQVVEVELPKTMNFRPRLEKHGRLISQGYPWFVAQVLQNETALSEYYTQRNSYENRLLNVLKQNDNNNNNNKDDDDDDEMNHSIRNNQSNKISNDDDNHGENNDNGTVINTDITTNSNIEKARVLAGVLWRKRAGVIANSFK